MRAVLALLLVGCAPLVPGETGETGGEDTAPDVVWTPDCLESGPEILVDIALESGGFGELADGVTLPVSIPPQGGAPYTPFAIRVTGTGDIHLGQRVIATATEDGVEIGSADIVARPICSNVAPNAGWWLTYGIHIRYWDDTVNTLAGRTVDFAFAVSDVGEGEIVLPPYAVHGLRATLESP